MPSACSSGGGGVMLQTVCRAKAVNSSCNLGKADSAPLPAPRSRTRTPPAPPAEIRFIDHTAWRKRCDRAFRLAESFWTGHNNEKIGDIQELIVDKSGKMGEQIGRASCRE